MVPGLLPIFLHSCEIKSGSGLGTRLGYVYVQLCMRVTILALVVNSTNFTELHTLILAVRSYALLLQRIDCYKLLV